MITRRRMMELLAVSLAAPLAAEAQQAGKIPRVGILAHGNPPLVHAEAFREGLRDLGYVEGQNIMLEWRWAGGDPDRYGRLAKDLVRGSVDVIVAGTTQASFAAKQATQTIPIVMAAVADPVGSGLVPRLSKPGSNITGMALLSPEMSAKRLEILKEAVRDLSRIAAFTTRNPAQPSLLKETQVAGAALGIHVEPIVVANADALGAAFRDAVRQRAQAVLTLQDSMFTIYRAQIAALALRHHLPMISGETLFAQAGGLMHYGANITDVWRRSARYVDKILKGAKPADLPVEQPTKFELVINLKTAKALVLTIPPSLLARADQVIE
jgi:putative tryptophan/tyrosine transport system substrate-binding protein